MEEGSAITLLFMIQWCSSQSMVATPFAFVTPRETPPGGCEMDQGLTDLSVQLQYRERGLDGDMGDWKFRASNRLLRPEPITEGIGLNSSTVDGLQIRLVQLEHGGGLCNCWSLTFTVTVNETTTEPESCMEQHRVSMTTDMNNITNRLFCGGPSREARGIVFSLVHLDPNSAPSDRECPGDSAQQLISPIDAPTMNCSTEFPRIDVSFTWNVADLDLPCQPVEGEEEGMELAVRNPELAVRNPELAVRSPDTPWIPLLVVYNGGAPYRNDCDAQNVNMSTVRGYQVPFVDCSANQIHRYRISLCGDIVNNTETVQFRWMGSARPRRSWNLDNVCVNLQRDSNTVTTLMSDSFTAPDVLSCTNRSQCELDSELWMIPPRRGARGCSCSDLPCPSTARSFLFNTDPPDNDTLSNLVTGILLTQSLNTTSPTSTAGGAICGNDLDSTTDSNPFQTELDEVEMEILADGAVGLILKQLEEEGPIEAVQSLVALTTARNRTVAGAYLLGIAVNQFVSIINTTEAREREQFSQSFLDTVENIKLTGEEADGETSVAGATLLTAVDQFALNVLGDNDIISLTETIGIRTTVLQPGNEELITTIDSSAFTGRNFPQRMTLQIPAELIQEFVNSSGRDDGGIRAAAAVYYDLNSDILPSTRPGMEDLGLASGIASTVLQCVGSNGICNTTTFTLASPVVITFQHPPDIQEMLSDGANVTTCVFLDITTQNSAQNDGFLSSGQWSDRGCTRNDALSNTSVTVCECTHLTHFAILLSAAPLSLSDPVTLSLEIIGYVGVSISLVAMAITVFTFMAFRTLRNMRNYIHINLCISLGIAQLTFVAGVGSTGDPVPIHCQVVAVLLHYFFLVSFMWMLMEGVILYIALVRVFVERKKLYLFAFTVTSYGLPLLYLGLLTLPLGFALPTQPNYGYDTACFLNPDTHFIWAFIAPVLVIIVINVGFFIMASSIMWRHQKKDIDKTNVQKVKSWLRSALSLVVIMGLTWIFGVLIVEVEKLVPLAYIYTILVAFQGVFIFLIFVVFSKQVREAYAKWWKVKVNESDFLSKIFGEKLSTSTKSVTIGSQTKTHPHESENQYVMMKGVDGTGSPSPAEQKQDLTKEDAMLADITMTFT